MAGTNDVNSKLGFGGAIYNNRGLLTLASCVVISNSAMGGKAASSQTNEFAGEAKGGAIFNDGGQLLLTNCILTANHVTGGAGAPGPASVTNLR